MKSWVEFWNSDTPIYVNDRHKALHYRWIARDMAGLIPSPQARVLDHGCGEALSADSVARRSGHLYLADAAPSVRERLAQRFAGNERITVLDPDDIEALPDGMFGLIVANSLVQYLSGEELSRLLRLWKAKLAPDGIVVVADVLPRGLGPLTDATALLSFGLKGGFLGAALMGLARTALSDYRKLRADLGLAHYDAEEMLALLAEAGFKARRRPANIGHNQARMAFIATHAGTLAKAD
jgi:SAM-dependent methyltransferase